MNVCAESEKILDFCYDDFGLDFCYDCEKSSDDGAVGDFHYLELFLCGFDFDCVDVNGSCFGCDFDFYSERVDACV
ncbi:Hypothetical protein PHPALM_12536 [Phytophthora palmivora]|uniref:Uncharacterized protein n=1 Tax=Phytophthora palmivora TaxID=4796 RepID=A0A2P4XZI2_9STRA|nr:Hypothetical protein PHPALM_12536 [Phytophthora palmivora]